MERSSNPTAPSQNQRPAQRDMMFCHECHDEWYRDEHGLTCPECQSDFTEVIEENNDPRDSFMLGQEDDDSDSFPDLEDPNQYRSRRHASHNDDPEEADISNFAFTQTAPGRFNVQATITRNISPSHPRGGMAPGSIGGFMSMLNGLAGAATARAQSGQRGQGQGQGEGLFTGSNTGHGQSAYEESRSPPGDGQPQIRTGRFTYHGGARLYPRDSDNPGPRIEPVDDISNVMAGLMAALGAPPGSLHTQQFQGGAEGNFRTEHTQNQGQGQMPPHPFLQLFTSMGLMGGGGQMGDFVYSQEGLDRIISQLMEQTASSNAPGPAAERDIDNLPRKNITEDMLGPEHTAECSICMDEVNIGEEVTMLPCNHWFHHQCVSAWLSEHDTCPHCRKGITKQPEGDSNPNPAPGAQSSSSPPRSSRMPGSFDVSGSGTPTDPYMVHSDNGPGNGSGNNTSSSANANSGADYQGNRWFGP